MRITHYHWTGPPKIGGIETYLSCLQRESKLEHNLIAGNSSSSDWVHYNEFLDPQSSTKACKLPDEGDILHAHNLHLIRPSEGKRILEQLKRTKKPLILSVHNLASDASEKVLSMADHIWVPSDYMKELLLNRFEQPAKTMPYTVSEEEKHVDIKEITKPWIVQPTRFTAWKGSYTSLNAFRSLDLASPSLIHGGSEALLSDDIPNDINESDNIHMQSFEPQEIRWLISNAELILHPTRGEGLHGEPFGISCYQAMIRGKQIIATKSGNLEPMLKPYSRKQFISPESEDDMKNAIRKSIHKRFELTESDKEYIQNYKRWMRGSPQMHDERYKNLLSDFSI